jgi:hypothetical protein
MTQQIKKKRPDLPAFAAEIRQLLEQQAELPPVDSWYPEREGEIDILINRNGEWLYQGEPMVRQSVVQLLSSILRKDGEDYFLVTPHEKLKICVEDVPFLVQLMDVEHEAGSESNIARKIHFSTQVGDCFTLSPEHAFKLVYNDRDEPAPYVHVRGGMYARLNRSVYYELVELLDACDASIPEDSIVSASSDHRALDAPGVWSAGKFHIFG